MISRIIQNRNRFIYLCLFAVGLGLYLPFRSIQYDPNGINEAIAIDEGGSSLFTPNHMLYRPLVWTFYRVIRNNGFRSIQIAQIITAIIAALGLGLFYIFLKTLIRSEYLAVIIALGMGTSWSYWVFSTDAYYIVIAAIFITGGFLLLSAIQSRPAPNRGLLLGLGGVIAAAILFWQANIFIVPAILISLYYYYRKNRRHFITAALWFSIPMMFIVGSVYLIVGTLVVRQTNFTGLYNWLFHYGAQLSMWGQINISRLTDLSKSMVSSVLPLWEGFGLRDLMHGKLNIGKNFGIFTLAAMVLLFVLPLLIDLRQRSQHSYRKHSIAWFLLAYLIYLPFILWWDPFEPKWLVSPNLALWALVALLWEPIAKRARTIVVLGILVITISTGNFAATIWPRHVQTNPNLAISDCVARHLSDQDLLVSLEWGAWAEYVRYFQNRPVFSMIDSIASSNGVEQGFINLQNEVKIVHDQGGKIYSVVFNNYLTPERMEWLSSQVGLTRADLKRIEGKQAFECAGIQFQEIISVH